VCGLPCFAGFVAYHNLNGSLDSVSGNLQPMWRGKFQPPIKSIPLNQSTKNLAQLITSERELTIPNLVQIHPLRASGQMDEIYQKLFLFIPFFSGTCTGQTRGWIFTRDSSKDVKSRKDVPFGGLNDVPLNFGGKTHQKLKFWGHE